MNLLKRLTRPAVKAGPRNNPDDNIIGFMLHANGRVEPVNTMKQGSGWYGGAGGWSYGQFGGDGPLTRSTMGFAAAYTVSTWIYRCIEAICDALDEVDWDIVRKGTNEPIENHPLKIAIDRNQQDLIRRILQSQYLYGESFIEKARNKYRNSENGNRGYVSDLYWLNNLGMAVLIGAGRIYGYTYTAVNGGYPQNFNFDQIAFMRRFNPFDDLRGMSVVEVVLDEVAIDKDVARVVRAFYANDARLGLIFIPKRDLLPSDQEAFMDAFKKDHQGVNKAGKPVLLPSDVSVERATSPGELDDAQLRESARRDICAAFGVPLAIAGAWDDANYDSVDTQLKSFYRNTVKPNCRKLERFINKVLLPEFDASGEGEFRFAIDELIAGLEDPNDKADKITKRWQAGEISWNEARRSNSDEEIEGGDDIFCIPSGYSIVSKQQVLSGQVAAQPATPEQTINRAVQQVIPKIAPAKSAELPSGKPLQTVTVVDLTPDPYDDILDELDAWQNKTKNKGAIKAQQFNCDHVPGVLQLYVRDSLAALDGEPEPDIVRRPQTYRDVFLNAKSVIVALKSYGDTQSDFKRTFRNAVQGAMADVVSRRSFGAVMRAALRQYGTAAYLDGLGETELDELGKTSVDHWLIRQSEYVSSFANEVFDAGLSPAQVDQRADLWAGNSLGEIYLDGLVRDKRDKRFKWNYKEESEHCNSCLKLNGQVHRLSQWYARDLRPKSQRLDCTIGCNCTIDETDEPSSGRFLG